MRKATRILLTLGVSAALLSTSAIPASAAEDGSSATIEVQGGILGINVVQALESTELKPGTPATFAVPGVAVADDRAVLGSWSVSVSLSDFKTEVAGAKPIPAAGATYSAAEESLTHTGTIESLVSAPVTLAGDSESTRAEDAVLASGVRGNNTAEWNATLSVPVPDDALAGTYKATLTHSVL
ncbi:WxL domain-containing protein [Arthrobacter sp. zg-Y750]|uniref:WxL domain-containing protein n=1 Tax=Arthrobacter sp. zg-Y750 TaxID=2894189 RepID=UPI001E509CB0|nr:WxL domain-containing protein [Arthrobacter sp. zg-Y750]MCC9176877.1 WxL domain-containing protein [Arthrobacter sp. zg-Y750]